jgi:hypothetical protein
LSPPPSISGKAGASEPEPLDGPGEDVRNGIRDSIERRLKRLGQPDETKSDVLKRLEKELRGSAEDSELPDGANPIPLILEAALNRRKLGSIAGLAQIYDELCNDQQWDSARIVSEIVDDLTPLVIDAELANEIWREIKVRKTALYFAPVNRAVAIEAFMAFADGKSMKVKPPQKDTEVEDFDGAPSFRGRKGAFGAPVEAEGLARDILIDLCESNDLPDSLSPSRTIDELVQRLASILIRNGTGERRGRTLYCFHAMPEDQKTSALHAEALGLIQTKLARYGVVYGLPAFIFVALAKTSRIEFEQSLLVQVLNARFRHLRNRTKHGTTSS